AAEQVEDDPRIAGRLPGDPDEAEPARKPSAAGLVPPPAPVLPEITLPKLDAKTKTVPLPGRVQRVAVGGGGRFIILHLATSRQLAVFDVSAAAIVEYIPADDGHVLFT